MKSWWLEGEQSKWNGECVCRQQGVEELMESEEVEVVSVDKSFEKFGRQEK